MGPSGKFKLTPPICILEFEGYGISFLHLHSGIQSICIKSVSILLRKNSHNVLSRSNCALYSPLSFKCMYPVNLP